MKVSVGLRGWRFDEDAIFTDAGEFRPLDEMDEDDRERIRRLQTLVERPCDACRLTADDSDGWRRAAAVYGEPMSEVILCSDHEADFVYWFREAGGRRYRGKARLRDAFHEWFDDGGRAPQTYGGVEHVDTDPETLPEPPADDRRSGRETVAVDLRAAVAESEADADREERADRGNRHSGARASASPDIDRRTDYPVAETEGDEDA